MFKFFNTFRGRLLLILAFLLIATLSVQYYLNLRMQKDNNNLREAQAQALVAGITLGANSLTSGEFLTDYVKREGQSFFDEKTTQRIKSIIVIDPDWEIRDSLDEKYQPSKDAEGYNVYKKLSTIKDLPPLMNGERLGEDLKYFPNAKAKPNEKTDGEAHAVPLETSDGTFYIMVILKTDKQGIVTKAAQPLIFTLLILLFSTAITAYLVWRFTRPISNLSKAAQRVAEGDLSFRLEDAKRTDEMGKLASQFNLMTAELAKTRELEMQLQYAEKSAVVGRLASAIAHEIRNPLNYINLTLDHLRAKFAPENEEKHENFEKLTAQLKTEVERINRQISDFLRYSRPAKLDLKPIDVRDVIDDSLRLVEAQADEQNIKISVVERDEISKISGDQEVLRSVFNNLFLNAAQAMEQTGGNLNVIVSNADDYVKIEVKDTGEGIKAENLDKIFEPYFSTKETGTGLGLAIVKKIIDEHRGFIDVESKTNEGTIFTIRLPKSDEQILK